MDECGRIDTVYRHHNTIRCVRFMIFPQPTSQCIGGLVSPPISRTPSSGLLSVASGIVSPALLMTSTALSYPFALLNASLFGTAVRSLSKLPRTLLATSLATIAYMYRMAYCKSRHYIRILITMCHNEYWLLLCC